MRRSRVSKTFLDQLNTLLEQGYPRFGQRVVTAKRQRVFDLISHRLVLFPEKRPDPDLDLCVVPVSGTPFVLVYDFDDDELRVHFILHGHADRSLLDPASAGW